MKKIILISVCTILSAQLISCSSSSKKNEAGSDYISRGEGSFQLQPYKEVILENGLKIIYVKDTTLPRVSLTMLMKVGNHPEPLRLAGLNAITAYLLEQGTQQRNSVQIADDFGQLGSSLDINAGYDFTTIYSDSLSMSADQLLSLFTDVIMNPAFQDKEVNRMRSQLLASVQKKVDNPSAYVEDKMDEFLFGSHSYGRDAIGTKETLSQIRKQDIIKHYLAYYRPNNASLAVVGNYSPEFEKKVQESFAMWTKRSIAASKVEAPPAIEGIQVKLIVKKGLQQTQIRIAQMGINRKDPDYLNLRVANEILGGSFASRLNQKVRDDLGLTYSISSFIEAQQDKGIFGISTFTKNETAGKTLDEALGVLNQYLKEGATDKEVDAARSQLMGQFPRAIETADRLAFNLLMLDFYGIPVEYLTNFNKNVEDISRKHSDRAIRKLVNPANLKVVVYGDPSIVPQFKKYNPTVEKP